MASDGAWLTYREAAKALGSNIEAVRQRAIRSRWPRTVGNDKRARIQIPEGLTIPVREGNEGTSRKDGDREPRKGNDRANDGPLIKALEANIALLREQLSTTEARLAAADAREARFVADLEAERAQTAKAIEAFAALADRLDQLAAERSRPWWRRLAG
jgi:hypothetical protein